MAPGVEMDAAVAEFVMGWDRDGCRTSSPPPPHFTVDYPVVAWGKKATPRVVVFDHPKHDGPAVFAPSTDDNAGSEVAAKLGVFEEITMHDKGSYSVRVRGVVAKGGSFREAVCRAALLTTL